MTTPFQSNLTNNLEGVAILADLRLPLNKLIGPLIE